MCSLLSSKYAAVQKWLVEDFDGTKRSLLLSITIDPAQDTPDVLRRYAKQQKAEPSLWRFATGKLETVTKLAFFCGADFWEDNGLVNHSLLTLVIDATGHVQRVFTDNDWAAEELMTELRHAARPLGDSSAIRRQ